MTRVKNWAKFQHFKDRRPPWIKLYRDILDDKEWHKLDPIAAKDLMSFWLIASEYDGELPDIETLAFRMRRTESEILGSISKLSHWLDQTDITLISTRYQAETVADVSDHQERETEAETKKETKAPAPRAFVLPDWIPSETWAAYCKVRTGKKAKNEPHALGLIVKDLEKFRAAGHDAVEILNNSIKSGWAGVFEPKTKPSVVGVTVPSAPGRDPALVKLDQDARITKPPTLETLARLAELRKPRLGTH